MPSATCWLFLLIVLCGLLLEALVSSTQRCSAGVPPGVWNITNPDSVCCMIMHNKHRIHTISIVSTTKIISEVVVDIQVNNVAATALVEAVGSIIGERDCEVEAHGDEGSCCGRNHIVGLAQSLVVPS